jgi:hypothetical protein
VRVCPTQVSTRSTPAECGIRANGGNGDGRTPELRVSGVVPEDASIVRN